MKFALLFGFWGNRYTEWFLDYSATSLLFPNNLPATCQEHEIIMRIATTESCIVQLETDARYQHLQAHYDVDVLTFPDCHTQGAKVGEETYSVWASLLNPLIHKHAVQGYNLLFMHPDSIYPDGFLEVIFSLAQAGKKMIFTAGVRVDAEQLAHTFAPSGGTPQLEPLAGAVFDQLTLAHLHEFVQRQFWHSTEFSHWPSALLFDLNDDTVIGRFFDMHPIYVAHDYADHTITHNIDVDYDYHTMVNVIEAEGWKAVGNALQPNGYFMSLTSREDTWANRLYLVGDDADAPLDDISFPQSDSEKFLHMAYWSKKYVPLKKVFCFQHSYRFNATAHSAKVDIATQHELDTLFQSILSYPLIMQNEKNPPYALELPNINININV